MAVSSRTSRALPTLAAAGLALLAGGALPAAHGSPPAPAGLASQAAGPLRSSGPRAAVVPGPATSPAGAGIVSEAPKPDGTGLWVAYANGAVTPVGGASSYGDLHTQRLDAPIRAIASTADGLGYWLLGADGGIFSFGDARFYGSTGGIRLNQPIVGMAPTSDDGGYWLVASDGGIFSFGDARFDGSTGSIRLNEPIVGLAPTPTGSGYWLVASDGGIFSFGDAAFAGSTGGIHLASPVVGMAATPTGRGYWIVASDGGVFTFGDAGWHGSAAGTLGSASAVGLIPAVGGYWIPTTDGSIRAFGAAPPSTTVVPGQQPYQPSPVDPLADPSASEPAPTGFATLCYTEADTAACDGVALQAIDASRSIEGLAALALPADYEALSPVQQLVVVTDAERATRGLPVLAGPSPSLDVLAAAGAARNADPTGPAGVSWASNWAGGVGSPLAADYLWMYDDGVGSSNVDCTPSTSSGCWGHRHNILVPYSGSMGAASVIVGGWTSMTELIAAE